MTENAIDVCNVTLSYRLAKTRSVRNALEADPSMSRVRALDGISFSVKKGEIFGIIGRNGGGKSTLLRTIAGIFVPDSGSIDLHGRNCSLLSIGVGFIGALSGRENIMLSGLLLGFSRKEIKEREEEIIEYSELGHFIDLPVDTYSSGMYSRLAFSITAMLRTDILLIDEVFSVGDEHFKQRSFETIQSLMAEKDRTVLLVSHILDQMQTLCTRIMWMDAGKNVMTGEPGEVIGEYRRRSGK